MRVPSRLSGWASQVGVTGMMWGGSALQGPSVRGAAAVQFLILQRNKPMAEVLCSAQNNLTEWRRNKVQRKAVGLAGQFCFSVLSMSVAGMRELALL